ncbi:unnamed protein product [Miscanthus lutarioriparius]|uniref:GDT1 family protein n=1 Tax=Miscanthus lutarioriparius TaxID=422564 RepID=A0A811PAM7_9POAL|nr:unnamed protein product [Miscanthus lutarioriparius]
MGSVAAASSCSTVLSSSLSTPFRARLLLRPGHSGSRSEDALGCCRLGRRPGQRIREGQAARTVRRVDVRARVRGGGGGDNAPGSQQALAAAQFAGLQPADVLGISGTSVQAFLLIFFSELGDRTFFIAALLAARSSGAVIFLGTFGALAVMTVISVVLGRAFHYVDGIIPFGFGGTDFPVDDIAAACLLVYYGVTTLLDAASGDDEKINEEQEEAELAVSKFSGNGLGVMSAAALAAASSPLGVIAGSLAGHAIATLIAVLGGSLLGTFLSEKIVAYIGGSLFLAFAAITIVEIVT